MTHPVLLHSLDHQDLGVVRERGAAYGDDVMSSLTFAGEFRDLQAHYPIVFRRTGDQGGVQFEALALFGFEQGENLFLGQGGAGWDAGYIPLAIERQPFMIGGAGDELHVHVDLDSPRIVRGAVAGKGEALFLPYGGRSDYLEQVNSMLLAIHQGLQAMPDFIAALTALGLLEPFVADIELNDGAQHRLAGFHTIDEDKLRVLPGEALERLSRAGYLQAIYMAVASLSNLRGLIARKQRLLGEHRHG